MEAIAKMLRAPDNGVLHVRDSYTVYRDGKLYGYCALGKIGIQLGLRATNREAFTQALSEKLLALTPEVQAWIRELNDSENLSFEEIAERLMSDPRMQPHRHCQGPSG